MTPFIRILPDDIMNYNKLDQIIANDVYSHRLGISNIYKDGWLNASEKDLKKVNDEEESYHLSDKIKNIIQEKKNIAMKIEAVREPVKKILKAKLSDTDKGIQVIDYAVSQLNGDFSGKSFSDKMKELGVTIIGWDELLDVALDKKLGSNYDALRAKLAVNNLKNKIIQNKGFEGILTLPGYN